MGVLAVRRRVVGVRMGVTDTRVTVQTVPVPISAMPVGMPVSRMRRVCNTAQRHDAEADTSERQAERVGIHWVVRRAYNAKGSEPHRNRGDRVTPYR